MSAIHRRVSNPRTYSAALPCRVLLQASQVTRLRATSTGSSFLILPYPFPDITSDCPCSILPSPIFPKSILSDRFSNFVRTSAPCHHRGG